MKLMNLILHLMMMILMDMMMIVMVVVEVEVIHLIPLDWYLQQLQIILEMIHQIRLICQQYHHL